MSKGYLQQVGELRDKRVRSLKLLDAKSDELDNLRSRLEEVQRALEEKSNRYQALSKAGREAILIYRDDGVMIANNSFVELSGYSEKELFPELVPTLIFRDTGKTKAPVVPGLSPCRTYKGSLVTKANGEIPVYIREEEVPYNSRGLCKALILTPWHERV